MAKFLTTFDINAELARLIRDAESEIILVSPYIKLHPFVRDILDSKKDRPQISITLLFGKNADNIAQSLSREDFEFFRAFPNMTIRYTERLHAKYYANESAAILTSMNLYDYSQNNNIEFGILLKSNFVKDIAIALAADGSLDSQAYNYFRNDVISKAKIMFRQEPEFDNGIAGSGISKNYIRSVVTANDLESLYKGVAGEIKPLKPVATPTKSPSMLTAPAAPSSGYCIRTGVRIPFNPKRPMSNEAYQNWSKFSNPDYPEKYCHFSGEPSNGETTFAKPVLKKNWVRAKEVFGV